MGPVQRRLVKGVLCVVAWPKVTLALAALLLAVSVGAAMLWLDVSTDQNKLFSPNVPFFRDYLRFSEEFPENEATYVVVRQKEADHKSDAPPPPTRQWIEAADSIASRLSRMPRYVSRVDTHVPLDAPGAPGILFDSDPAAVAEALAQAKSQLVPLAQIWGGRPGTVQGLFSRLASARTRMETFLADLQFSEPDESSVRFLPDLADSWTQAARRPREPVQVPSLPAIFADSPRDLGYYYEPDQTNPSRSVLLIRVYEQENSSSLGKASESIEAIRQAVREQARSFPQFRIGLTGRPVLDADEMKTSDRDSHNSETIALAVVFLGLVLLLRSIWLAVVAEVSLAVAIGWTFGWATLSVHELNLLSTVFLIALIGIGMDYLIQILAAYRREARRYVRPSAIWARVFRYVGPPVVTACLGAAGAFFVSVFTDFRGAAQLGIIAGGGLLLCLLAGYTVLPALLVLFPVKLEPYAAWARYGTAPPRSRWRLVLPGLWIAALLAGIPFALKTSFNPNLLDLQAPNLQSVQLVRKLQTWSAVVLSKDLSMLRKVRDAVRPAPTVAGTESILTAFDNDQWLHQHAGELPAIEWMKPEPVRPADLPQIARRARNLAARFQKAATPATPSATTQSLHQAAAALQTFADVLSDPKADPAAVAAALSGWQDKFVEELKTLLTQFNPPPLKVQNIPRELRSHLVSQNGDYALYVYPRKDLWNRQNLDEFEKQVEARVASVPGAPPVTGITSDIYNTTRSIERAFYSATAYALGLIFVLVLIDLRDIRQTLIAVSVLLLGLPMLVALMGALHASWNFANFFGLPILIGAGHEYGVFMMHRYREVLHDPRRVWRRWDPADRALLLCAFVTSSSFGFFWLLAHHKGLESLGLVMALGTACIYLATILVVRPLLTLHLQRLRKKQSEDAASDDAESMQWTAERED